MNMTGNTILVTGGGSGIGRRLAEEFHKLGNTVVVTGRDQRKLDAVTTATPGIRSIAADVSSPAGIKALTESLKKDFPALNAVIHSAGMMKFENLLEQPESAPDVDATIATNLTGPIRLTAALLPLLLKQPRGMIMTVSSGLAFVPLAMTPTYNATKAALHSYTESLRYQLRDTKIQVLELIPPYVQTTLSGDHQAKDPAAMPLEDFIAETMDLLTRNPDAPEINVGRVHPMRYATEGGRAKYDQLFKTFNDAMTAARQF